MKRENNHPHCPFCGSHTVVVKNGIIVRRKKEEVIGEHQRYLCKSCMKNFYDDTTSPIEDKHRQALIMYLEGMNFSEIGKFLGVNHDTVRNWFNKYGIDLDVIQPLRNTRRKKEIKLIEQVYAIEIRNDINDYKPNSFNDGFIILEKENKVHISSLKENQKYKMVMRDKDLPEKLHRKEKKMFY